MKAIVQAHRLGVHEPDGLVDLPPAAEQEPNPDPGDAGEQPASAFTDPGGVRPPRRPRDARQILAEPIPVREFVVPGMLARGDRALLVATDLLSVTLLGWQVAVQAAVGIHPVTLQSMRPVRVLLVDHQAPEDTMKPALHRLVAAAGGRGLGDRLTVMAAWDGVAIPHFGDDYPDAQGVRRAWWQLAEEHRPDLVVTTIRLPSLENPFTETRTRSVLWTSDYRSLGDGRLNWNAVAADLGFGLSRKSKGKKSDAETDSPGTRRLRRERGQLAYRPGWPGSLHYDPQALEHHRWPWTATKRSKSGAKRTPPPASDPVWEAIVAVLRKVDQAPSQRKLAETLEMNGIKPCSVWAVNEAIKAHRAEYDALLRGR